MYNRNYGGFDYPPKADKYLTPNFSPPRPLPAIRKKHGVKRQTSE